MNPFRDSAGQAIQVSLDRVRYIYRILLSNPVNLDQHSLFPIKPGREVSILKLVYY